MALKDKTRVACPACGAAPGWQCRNRRQVTRTHQARLVLDTKLRSVVQ